MNTRKNIRARLHKTHPTLFDRNSMAKDTHTPSSMPSVLRAYAVPIFLFVLSMFFQLFLLPHSFPPSHYDGTLSIYLNYQLFLIVWYWISYLFPFDFSISFGYKDVQLSGWRERGVREYCFQVVTFSICFWASGFKPRIWIVLSVIGYSRNVCC